MFWNKKNRQDRSYVSVATTFIIIGAIVFTFGAVSWLVNIGAGQEVVNAPAVKLIGGLIVMSLGYIQLELGLIREK